MCIGVHKQSCVCIIGGACASASQGNYHVNPKPLVVLQCGGDFTVPRIQALQNCIVSMFSSNKLVPSGELTINQCSHMWERPSTKG